MIIGGGFIRDSILGGQINDIDVWIPSNANASLSRDFVGENIIFQNSFSSVQTNGEYTTDISNRFVVESFINGIRINYMKTLYAFESVEQYFSALMRNFDNELSMFFMAFDIPDNKSYTTAKYKDFITTDRLIVPSCLCEFILDPMNRVEYYALAVNGQRWETTSQARKQTRLDKMSSRYHGLLIERNNLGISLSGNIDRGAVVLPVGDFLPTPVSISRFVQYLNKLPLPVIANEDTGEILPSS